MQVCLRSAHGKLVAVLLGVALTLAGCDINVTTPSPVVTISNQNNNQNNNNNNNTNNPPPPGTCCPGVGNGSPTTPIGPRTPDPIAGGVLPYPASAEAIVRGLGGQFPELLARSCQAVFGPTAWGFLDKVIDTLRASDGRWGYVCKQGNCATPSEDTIAYHATSGPDVQGALGTWEIDVIGAHCAAPVVQWLVHAFMPTGVWGTRGRF
jgi:hypothetical protein